MEMYKTERICFPQLADKIESHATIEEKIFYPRGQEVDETMTLRAYEEHDVVKSLIKKLKNTASDDKTFTAKITVLKEAIQHHVREEEEVYFKEVKKTLGDKEILTLGTKLKIKMGQLEKDSSKGLAPAKAAATRQRR